MQLCFGYWEKGFNVDILPWDKKAHKQNEGHYFIAEYLC